MLKANFYPLRYDLLRDPAWRAFMETPAWVTCQFLMANAIPHIQRLRSGTEIAKLNDVFPGDDTEYLIKTDSPLGIALGGDLAGRGWMCAEISDDFLIARRPERAVEQIQDDIELLAAMDFLEIHRALLNGKETRVAKLGEWVVHNPADSD